MPAHAVHVCRGLAILVLMLGKLQAAQLCGENECCEGTLNEFQVLSGSSAEMYGTRKVFLEPHVKQMPNLSDNEEINLLCDEVYRENVSDTEASMRLLFSQSSSYCREKDITIMSGASWLGFNLPQSLDVCLGSTSKMNASDEARCEAGTAALEKVETATFEVVFAMTQLTLASQIKKSDVKQLIAAARDLMLDDGLERKINRQSDTAQTIINLYEDILQNLKGSGGDAYTAALQVLRTSFQNLKTVFDDNFQHVIETLSDCNVIIPRTDRDGYMIYDICSVKSVACIQDASGDEGHVSACCAYNPIAQLSGLSKNGENDVSAATFFDVCSEQRGDIRRWYQNVTGKIDPCVYDEYIDQMRAAHPSFNAPDIDVGECTTKHDNELEPAQRWEYDGHCAETSIKDLYDQVLTPELGLETNSYRDLTMVYDFDREPSSENWCSKRTQKDLFDTCEHFCGAASVPLLVGTIESTVPVEDAINVCFSANVVGPSNASVFCQTEGKQAMRILQSSLAQFTAKLVEFRMHQLLFVTLATDIAEQASEEAASTEVRDRVQSKNTKTEMVTEYIQFYSTKFDAVEDANTELVASSNAVKTLFEQLRSSFDTGLPNLERFAQECGQPFPRTAGGQPLLAVCPNSGNLCADDKNREDSSPSYVFCCCAESSSLDQTGDIDVCAARNGLARDETRDTIAKMETLQAARRSEGTATDGIGYYRSYVAGMRQRYASDYDPPDSGVGVGNSTQNKAEETAGIAHCVGAVHRCKCDRGYVGADGGPCSPCSAGEYQDEEGQRACKQCPFPDKSSSSPGASSVTGCRCGAGYEGDLHDERAPCILCALGSYKDSEMLSCALCPDGTYSGNASQSRGDSCLACPPSMISVAGAVTASQCVCKAGFEFVGGSVACRQCPIATYSQQGLECAPCPNFTTSPIASESVAACHVCVPGYVERNGNCTPCPANTFQSQNKCSPCPEHSESSAGQGSCACTAGFHAAATPDSLHHRCDPPATSDPAPATSGMRTDSGAALGCMLVTVCVAMSAIHSQMLSSC